MKSLFTAILLFLGTGAALAQFRNLTVAQDGSGDFITVQAAIDAVVDNNAAVTTIFIKNGVYKEKLTLPETKTNVHFIGEDVRQTILTYDDYASKKDSTGKDIGTSGSASFLSTALVLLPKILRSRIQLAR